MKILICILFLTLLGCENQSSGLADFKSDVEGDKTLDSLSDEEARALLHHYDEYVFDVLTDSSLEEQVCLLYAVDGEEEEEDCQTHFEECTMEGFEDYIQPLEPNPPEHDEFEYAQYNLSGCNELTVNRFQQCLSSIVRYNLEGIGSRSCEEVFDDLENDVNQEMPENIEQCIQELSCTYSQQFEEEALIAKPRKILAIAVGGDGGGSSSGGSLESDGEYTVPEIEYDGEVETLLSEFTEDQARQFHFAINQQNDDFALKQENQDELCSNTVVLRKAFENTSEDACQTNFATCIQEGFVDFVGYRPIAGDSPEEDIYDNSQQMLSECEISVSRYIDCAQIHYQEVMEEAFSIVSCEDEYSNDDFTNGVLNPSQDLRNCFDQGYQSCERRTF